MLNVSSRNGASGPRSERMVGKPEIGRLLQGSPSLGSDPNFPQVSRYQSSAGEFRKQLQFASSVSSVKFGWRSSNRITTIDTNRGTRHKIRGS